MSSDVPRARYRLPKFSKDSYAILMKTLENSLTFDTSDIAKFRLHVLRFYFKHGWKPTVEAFKIGKSTLYDWRKAYGQSGKKLVSLVPKSTRPKNLRRMKTDWRLEAFIRALREEYGAISKYKIKPFLDEYARELGVSSYGLGKIGKIIKRRNYFFQNKVRVKRKRKRLTPRLRYAPKEKAPGYIEMDSITLYIINRRYYFITAIDIVTKYAWCKLAKSLSSKQARLALEEFKNQYSHPLRVIQTDNGSEFLGEFHRYTEENQIKHEFIYPRSPKINGVVERFNQTIQTEFIKRCDALYYDLDEFNQKLVRYLAWYNTRRPHYSLKFDTPANYLKKFI